MDEIDQIQALQMKIGALLRVRNHLLNQTPSDMVAIAHVTERIVDLNSRIIALATNPNIPMLTEEQKGRLVAAIQRLDKQIANSNAATTILASATALMNAA